MTVLISALAFLVLLSVLVLIHECGHFFAARWFKVDVEEFGFGLPPRASTMFWQGGTRFSLNWIPFGGFVRLKGENATGEAERRLRGNFAAATIPARVVILIAGVVMNFLLAVIIFTIGFSAWGWVPTYLSEEATKAAAARGEIALTAGVRIAGTIDGGTAQAASVPFPSVLLAVDDQPVYFPGDVRALQQEKTSVRYTVREEKEGAKERTITLRVRDGKTGVELQGMPNVTSPPRDIGHAVLLSFREAKVATVQTVLGIGQLFRSVAWSGTVPEGITGIVGIAQLTHSSIQAGLQAYLRLVAILSLSLAVLNILPFPALDGGRLMFVLIEGIRRQPAPRRLELVTNTVGFLILIVLIVLVTFNDILKLF